jgi:hypothetical protein
LRRLLGWDLAIASAIKQLRALEAMVAKITFSLNYFLERKRDGDPFPGEEKLKAAHLIHDI